MPAHSFGENHEQGYRINASGQPPPAAGYLRRRGNTLHGVTLDPTGQRLNLPSIPEVTVSHGVAAYTNHCWTVLAAKKGFLKDVGITLNGGAPKVLRDQQLVPSLQNGEVDITTMYLGLITQALDKVTNVKPILVYSFWQGNTILTSPNLGFKTVDEFLAQGMPWEQAAAAATAQLKGQKFTVTANPSTYPWIDFALGLGGLSMKDTQAVPIEDPKAVQLAINDQVPFAAPGGAVQIYQLQYQANWKSVISTRQMVESHDRRSRLSAE